MFSKKNSQEIQENHIVVDLQEFAQVKNVKTLKEDVFGLEKK